jgi:glutamate formiminotransferase/formiminotetrahydrofolate cyclodeaminase
MPTPLVECIPNFSDARRPEVVEAIVASITAITGVTILDRHSDLDHNRTVVTFVGPPAAVEEAAFQSIATAAKLINLDEHTGAHPRIGATDVVPFVPISDVTMTDCVEMARRLGKRVGTELRIPVYLYEEAATRPERQGLENIRRGQYEALKVEMGTNPERNPDFGPAMVGPAGATVIGARQPLIAFNVYLTTDDVTIAQKIGKAVRHSSGGMRFVKGMGVLVEGRAQVSMNLTNYRSTPIARVVELVRREAQRYGVGIHHTELVGLIPQEALVDAAVWYLQLDQFEPQQILESRLFSASQSAPVETKELSASFLDALAGATPTPGGGSASAFTGAAGAALVAMVGRLTVGKKKYAAVEPQMWSMIDQAENLRKSLTEAVERDAAAFDDLMTAMRLPKETEEQQEKRNAAIRTATLQAARIPLEVARMSVEVMRLAVTAATLGNLNAISDGATGGALAKAALTGAGYNVRINLLDYAEQPDARELLDTLAALEKDAASIEVEIRTALTERGGFSLA